MNTAVIDPALRELVQKRESSEPVNAFVRLRTPDSAAPIERLRAAAEQVVSRVERATRITPKFHYRALDNVLQIVAPSRFLQTLFEQPEVCAASAVPDYSSALIEPVGGREVSPDAIDRPLVMPKKPLTRPRSHRAKPKPGASKSSRR